MTAKPIIFSAPMVRAILAGTKTETRRVLKPQPPDGALLVGLYGPRLKAVFNPVGNREGFDAADDISIPLKYLPGDLLWVREAWGHDAPDLETLRAVLEDALPGGRHYGPYYMADGDWATNHTLKKRPSIHMPRWASRVTLRVKAVKVERLQAISWDDARAEGLRWVAPTYGIDGLASSWSSDPRESFRALWNSINGDDAWDANPWVAAYTFERIKP
jgi:hypothetical protein